ncbi:uncharacterized protein ACN427_012799 isoform 1-T2 [Glossina fuscipes fuscipes]
MDCLFTPCRAKIGPESEQFISYWLCDRFGHAKCAGITGRAADAILDPSKGLRWSCPDYRKRDIDFYKLFTETRNCFSDLSKNLGSLWEKFEIIKTRFDECRYIAQSSFSPASKVSTRSVACGSSPLHSPKSVPSVQVRDSLKSTKNVSVSATAESVGNIKNTKKAGSPSGLSYAEVARVSPPIDVTQSSQASSPTTNEGNSKSSSPPLCSSVNAGRQTEQVAQAVRARVVTPSIFSSTHNSSSVNPAAPSTDDICLKAVPPRKAIFVSRLAPDTSVEKIRGYLAAKAPSVNLKRVSIFKLGPSQSRAISSFKILVPTENMNLILNKPLWPVGSLIKEFIPRDRPRNANALALSFSKN